MKINKLRAETQDTAIRAASGVGGWVGGGADLLAEVENMATLQPFILVQFGSTPFSRKSRVDTGATRMLPQEFW